MIDKHLITTFKDVFEEEIDRNGKDYPDINENCRFWLGKLPFILDMIKTQLDARLRGLEWSLARELALDKISGGFVSVKNEGLDDTRDALFYKLTIKHGVQSDCENRVETSTGWLHPITMEVSYEDI